MKNKSIISLLLGSITFCLFLLTIVFYLISSYNFVVCVVFGVITLIMLATTALYISYYKENFTTNEKQHF